MSKRLLASIIQRMSFENSFVGGVVLGARGERLTLLS